MELPFYGTQESKKTAARTCTGGRRPLSCLGDGNLGPIPLEKYFCSSRGRIATRRLWQDHHSMNTLGTSRGVEARRKVDSAHACSAPAFLAAGPGHPRLREGTGQGDTVHAVLPRTREGRGEGTSRFQDRRRGLIRTVFSFLSRLARSDNLSR